MKKTSAAARLFSPLRAAVQTPEAVASDTDIGTLRIGGKRFGADLRGALLDAKLSLTLEGAPSLELELEDPDVALLRSKLFGTGNLDGDGVVLTLRGVKWRLMGLRRASSGQLSATFEDETVAALRGIVRKRVATRGKVNRAQFVAARVRELRPVVKFVCPELNERQPLAGGGTVVRPGAGGSTSSAPQYGLPRAGIKVKRVTADAAQRRNIETILDVGVAKGASRKAMEAAIAAATQESEMRTSATNGNHVGLFQMDGNKGTVAQRRDAKFAATWFFRTAAAKLKANPGLSVPALCEAVEVSGNPSAYAQWTTEARTTVTAYMGSSTATSGVAREAQTAQYMFSIGAPGGEVGETFWDGLQRLAGEVEWRFFVIANEVYLASETRLYAQRPLLTLDMDSPLLTSLEFDVDAGMRVAEATAVVDAELWGIPPGSTVEFTDAGPATGRWLVTEYQRSLFGTDATLSLRKARPKLPEPAAEQLEQGGITDTVTTDQDVPKAIRDAYAKAVAIDKHNWKYTYGGGHNPSFSGPHDCSGAVSAILHAAGKLSSPTDTVGLGRFGKSGKGKYLTIYVKPLSGKNGHTYAVFNLPGKGEQRFEAHGPSGVGPGGQFVSRGSDSGYDTRHIEGM